MEEFVAVGLGGSGVLTVEIGQTPLGKVAGVVGVDRGVGSLDTFVGAGIGH